MSFTYKLLEERDLIKLREWFPKVVFAYQYNPGKFIAPKAYNNIAQDVFDFKILTDDVWVVSYPRTGK